MMYTATNVLLKQVHVVSNNAAETAVAGAFMRNIAMPIMHSQAAHVRVLDNPTLTPSWCLINAMCDIDRAHLNGILLGQNHRVIAMRFAEAQAICNAVMFTVDGSKCVHDGSEQRRLVVFVDGTDRHMSPTMRTLADEIMAASKQANFATKHIDVSDAAMMARNRDNIVDVFQEYSTHVLRASRIAIGEHIIGTYAAYHG